MFADSVLGLLAGGGFTGLLALAAYGDFRTRRIRNWLVALVAVSGLAYTVTAGPVGPGLLRSIEGFGTGLAFWLPFYVLGWLGAGDVKLFAAAGCWLGPSRAFEGAFMAAFVGAGLAVVWMIATYGLRKSLSIISVATAAPSILATAPRANGTRRRTLPYGVALAIGAIIAAWMPGNLLLR